MEEDEEYNALWDDDDQYWDEIQNSFDRLELDSDDISDEWDDGVPPEIQEMIDYYKDSEI